MGIFFRITALKQIKECGKINRKLQYKNTVALSATPQASSRYTYCINFKILQHLVLREL